MNRPSCIRCGWCCLIAPCGVAEVTDNVCGALIIHEDMTTSCAIWGVVGDSFGVGGCTLRSSQCMIDLHEEMYDPEQMKRERRYVLPRPKNPKCFRLN